MVFNVREEGPEHLRWPDLDVDLARFNQMPKRFPNGIRGIWNLQPIDPFR